MELTELKQIIADDAGALIAPAVAAAVEAFKAELPALVAAEFAKEATPDKLRELVSAAKDAPGRPEMPFSEFKSKTPAEQLALAKARVIFTDEKE